MTLAFTANVVDSLCAIDKVCFRDKKATLPEFLDAVRSNWKGPRGEELRLRALDAPYWGDNSPESNGLMRWLFESVARDLDGLQNEHGSPFVLAAWIYREFLFWGMNTKATPDGRHDGDRLAHLLERVVREDVAGVAGGLQGDLARGVAAVLAEAAAAGLDIGVAVHQELCRVEPLRHVLDLLDGAKIVKQRPAIVGIVNGCDQFK